MENGRSARILIGVLGSFVAILLVVVAFALTAGGGDSEAEASVTIQNAYAVGNDAVVEFTVANGGETAQVSIDWGDGSTPLALSGHGAMSASYVYGDDQVDALVTVTMTATGGAVLSTSRQIAFNGVGPADTSTTTTEDDGDDPEQTTTTAPGSTTPTPPTTTTTTAPESQPIEIALYPFDATFDEGSGGGTASLESGRVRMYLRQDAFDRSATRTATVTWTFSAADLGLLEGEYQVNVLMNPDWEVYLWTGPNPGRSASWSYSLVGLLDGEEFSRSDGEGRQIGNNDVLEEGDRKTLGFGGPLPDDWDVITLRLELTCAVTAGDNIFQVGESSICDARDSGRGFTIGPSRIRFVPVD